MNKFAGKVVIVTGAGGGIGSVTAKAFAAEGAKVAVVDYNEELAMLTCKEIETAGGVARKYVVNVTVFDEVAECVKQVVADFGGVDILCNIAGGSARKRRALSWEQDPVVFDDIIKVNLYGTYFLPASVPK